MKFLVLILFAPFAFANFDHSPIRGENTIHYKSLYGEEACILPKMWNANNYSQKDKEKEAELCQLNFYGNDNLDRLTAVCPKMKSTNPGLEIYKIKSNKTKQQFEASECYKQKPNGKKVAKFKQSITCSYTPSIVGYYHLSRILNAGRVPVAVVRTMAQKGHEKYSLNGQKIARARVANKSLNSGSVIYNAWAKAWPSAHRNLGKTVSHGVKIKPRLVFNRDYSEVYGALSVNPRGEEKYREVYGRFKYDTRYETFKKQPAYKRLTDSRSVDRTLGTDFRTSIAYRVQMKDLSDMIIMDLIMSQQDRPGNIHYKNYWYYLDGDKIKTKKVKYDDKDNILAEQKIQMQNLGAVIVKQMLLKDNDCGVTKSNNAKIHDLLGPMKHMSAETYERFSQFVEDLNNPEFEKHIKNEWLFTSYDFKKLKERSLWLKRKLDSKIANNKLMLDL